MRREKAGNGQGAGDAVVGDTILKSQSELEKSQTSCGRGSKDSSKYEPKVIEEEKQSSGSGSRLHGRTESLDESNDTGPLLSIASTTVPVTHEGRSERLSSLDKLFDTESISTTRSVMVLAAVQTREDDPPGDDALQDDLCDNLFDSLSESPKREISKLKLEWGTGKRAAVDLNPPSLPKPPDLSSSPVPSDWTSQLFTREELASMIDHEVQNVYLDCPHCNLIVRHGLPIPLPFELKEKCVCTFPRLQATGYRAQTSFKPIGKNGRRERMTLGDLEFEKALREKRVLIGEVIDRCVEEAKAAVSWETDTYSAQSKIEALTMSDVGGEMEPSLDVLEGREKMEEKEEKEGDGGDPVGAKKTMKGSSPAKKTSKVSTKAKKPQKRRPR
ncbi:hypothetical protein BKA64DRAFT_682664 [Cadophora sp. MPI-SDFR-AT-0126]|nr:hypothetical protein BKA64DRAFT_682664 [Leotiomycetes sp. MPI-SDFR-AT-0126]